MVMPSLTCDLSLAIRATAPHASPPHETSENAPATIFGKPRPSRTHLQDIPFRHNTQNRALRRGSGKATDRPDVSASMMPGSMASLCGTAEPSWSSMRQKRHPACCTEEEEAKNPPFPTVDQATRTEFGHPRSSIRLRTWAAMATSVARASSLWKRSPSPMTCFQRANWPSTRALSL
jgi:hypothetical protein